MNNPLKGYYAPKTLENALIWDILVNFLTKPIQSPPKVISVVLIYPNPYRTKEGGGK